MAINVHKHSSMQRLLRCVQCRPSFHGLIKLLLFSFLLFSCLEFKAWLVYYGLALILLLCLGKLFLLLFAQSLPAFWNRRFGDQSGLAKYSCYSSRRLSTNWKPIPARHYNLRQILLAIAFSSHLFDRASPVSQPSPAILPFFDELEWNMVCLAKRW